MTESALSSFFHTVQGEQEFNGELDSEPVVFPVSDEPLYMSDKRWVPAIYVHARHGADQAFIDNILKEYTKKYFNSETKTKYHVLNEYEEYIILNDKDNNFVNIKKDGISMYALLMKIQFVMVEFFLILPQSAFC